MLFAEDDDIYLQVRGGFGKSADEDKGNLIPEPDTRWVQLAQLVDNGIDGKALNQLEKLAKALRKPLVKAAAKRIQDREAEGERRSVLEATPMGVSWGQ